MSSISPSSISSLPSVMHTAAYNIYARELFPRRHGYALWHPEHTKSGEVQIGDVGYLLDGAFYRMFNATRSGEQTYGVPEGHEPYVFKQFLLNQTKDVIKASLVSKSVTSYDISGNAGTSLQAVGAGLKFTCERENGAFVVVKPSADRLQLHPSKALTQYIRTHFDSWKHFASDNLDLDIPPHDIILISGTVKTDDWGLGAFLRYESGGAINFEANVGPVAQAAFNVTVTQKHGEIAECRSKPTGASLSPPLSAMSDETADTLMDPSSSSLSLKRTQTGPRKDQCLFIHYYKMKKRLFFNKVIKAAAGPDELDPGSGSEGEDGMSVDSGSDDVTREFSTEKMFDPVDYVLDYILGYVLEDGSQADAAIAGISHLYTLFDEDIPEDIPAALEKLQPPILFVDDGVAALACAEWSEEFNEIEQPEYNEIRGKQKAPDADPSPTDPGNRERNMDVDRSGSPGSQTETPNKGRRTDTAHAYETLLVQDHTGGVACAAWSPDGRYIATGAEDHTVVLRDGTSGAFMHKFVGHDDTLWSLAFSPDSRRLATGANNGTALVWDIETRNVMVVLDGHTKTVNSIEFTSDGSKIATASVDCTARIWDSETGALLHTMEEEKVVISAHFSPNGKYLATCGSNYVVKIWDVDTGELFHTLVHHEGIVWAVDFDPHSRRIITGSDDAMSIIWSVESGDPLVILREHPSPVWAVAFSPDGKQVMSASNDMTIKLCDSFTGELLYTFNRNDALVNSAVFSPDGNFIASGGGDNEVLVWSTRTGNALAPMQGHEDKINSVRFSPDSDRLVTASDDGTVRLWTLLNLDEGEAQGAPQED